MGKFEIVVVAVNTLVGDKVVLRFVVVNKLKKGSYFYTVFLV